MKLLWALLDIGTIVILGSGLYLWLKRKRAAKPVRQGQGAAHDAPALAASNEAS
jgi:uncharacterized iron-regulated membrane protein